MPRHCVGRLEKQRDAFGAVHQSGDSHPGCNRCCGGLRGHLTQQAGDPRENRFGTLIGERGDGALDQDPAVRRGQCAGGLGAAQVDACVNGCHGRALTRSGRRS